MALAGSKDIAAARKLLSSRIEGKLVPKIDTRLRGLERRFGESRDRSVLGLAATTNKILLLTIVVGVLAAALVVVGAALVRRWLFVPLLELHRATEQLRKGDYALRVSL